MSFGLVATEANGWPEFTPVLLRTPGSVWANAISGKNNAAKIATADASFAAFIPDLLRLGSALSPLAWRTSERGFGNRAVALVRGLAGHGKRQGFACE